MVSDAHVLDCGYYRGLAAVHVDGADDSLKRAGDHFGTEAYCARIGEDELFHSELNTPLVQARVADHVLPDVVPGRFWSRKSCSCVRSFPYAVEETDHHARL